MAHTEERRRQLEEVLPLAQKYHDALQNVEGVVSRAETQLESFSGPVADLDKAKQQLSDIKVRLSLCDKPFVHNFPKALIMWQEKMENEGLHESKHGRYRDDCISGRSSHPEISLSHFSFTYFCLRRRRMARIHLKMLSSLS